MLIQIREYREEINRLIEAGLPYENLYKSNVLIAGASGMIGSALVDTLMVLSESKSLKLNVYALGRDRERLEKRFLSYIDNPYFHIIEQDISEPIVSDIKMDYIVHAASDANPIAYASHPVEVMRANFYGMNNLLEYGRSVSGKRVLYISSGEMYGKLVGTEDGFMEDYVGYVDYSDARSCYPSAKRATEALCQSYIQEYGMDIVIVRPCHIYGPTMTENDTRAVSAFIRNVLHHENIVLRSDGSARRSMCYIMDVIEGLLYVLFLGKNGQAYNISNDKGVASILELAELIANVGKSEIIFDIPSDLEKKGFNRVQKAVLVSEKLKGLGWSNHTDLADGLAKTMSILEKKEILYGKGI